MLGVDEFNRGVQLTQRLRARGIQHAVLGRMAPSGTRAIGIDNYGTPLSVAHRMIARGKGLREFGVGRMSGTPWYEALFKHIETIAPIASQFVLQFYGMYGSQRAGAWAQASADQKQEAYLLMMKDMVARQSGQQGQMDNNTYKFFQQQLASDPNRQSYFYAAANGNQAMANQLEGVFNTSAGIGFDLTTWIKNPIVVMLGVGALVGVGVLIYKAASN